MTDRMYKSALPLRPDNKPLCTKIVATIGNAHTYATGIVDLAGREVPKDTINYTWLVDTFYRLGVDVIRINMSHVSLEKVAGVFREVKDAILESERSRYRQKRIAVLADLPGPKIRFDMKEEIPVSTGDEFTVVFDEIVSTGRTQTVYIDSHPLKKSMDLIDHRRRELAHVAVALGDMFTKSQPGEDAPNLLRVAENVLGQPISLTERRSRFNQMMDQVARRLSRGEQVLVFIGDSDVVMRVRPEEFDRHATTLPCEVVTVKGRGVISGKKGFTLKGIDIDFPTFTEQDRAILNCLLDEEYRDREELAETWEPVLGFVGLSFTQRADDVLTTRKFMEDKLINDLGIARNEARLNTPGIVSKIETNQGWENRHLILDVTDGVMLARGDLGLQVEIERVPEIQKRLVELCKKRGRPVITATQMLSSMTNSIEPTRAEVSDVFNAIQDGTDAVMVSEETATGRFPMHTLEKMKSIATTAERFYELQGIPEALRREMRRQRTMDFLKDDYARIRLTEARLRATCSVIDARYAQLRRGQEMEKETLDWRRSLYINKLKKAIQQEKTNRMTEATCTMAEATGVRAIVAATTSGRSVRMLARLRPRVTMVAGAHDMLNTRKLLICYGVLPVCIGSMRDLDGTEGLFQRFKAILKEHHPFVRDFLSNSTVLFSAGSPIQTSGTTNMLQIRDMVFYEDEES